MASPDKASSLRRYLVSLFSRHDAEFRHADAAAAAKYEQNNGYSHVTPCRAFLIATLML